MAESEVLVSIFQLASFESGLSDEVSARHLIECSWLHTCVQGEGEA
jgi:hypothetical protein